jgi:hypothetical protein
MARRFIITASVLATGLLAGSALAQPTANTGPTSPTPAAIAADPAAAALAVQIENAVAALGPNATPAQIRAAIARVVIASGASPQVASVAVASVATTSTSPAVVNAANAVNVVIASAGSTGGPALGGVNIASVMNASQVASNTQVNVLISQGSSANASSSFSAGTSTNSTAAASQSTGAPPTNTTTSSDYRAN